MGKLLSLAVVGVAAAGLMLAAPSTSQAQSCDYGGYGGSYGGAGYRGYASYGGYDRGYAPGYGGGYYDRGSAPGYGGAYGRRPVIEHPTSSHWTPFRGYHEHGHIHVPHRFHSHTYRY